jgi:CheY-like chemotaxis protein
VANSHSVITFLLLHFTSSLYFLDTSRHCISINFNDSPESWLIVIIWHVSCMLILVKRILVVEDNDLIVYSIKKTLNHYHADVCVACDGADAVHKISSHCYDLCLIDIHLPDINGLEILKQIKTFSPSTKIAVMTTPPIGPDAKIFIETEAINIIEKPYNLPEMKLLLNGLLEDKSLSL